MKGHDPLFDWTPFALPDWRRSYSITEHATGFSAHHGSQPSTVSDSREKRSVNPMDKRVRIGLIDDHCFSRDCVIRAFNAVDEELVIVPFSAIPDRVRAMPDDLDVVLFYSHDDGLFEVLTIPQLASLRQVFGNVPILVLSDARSALLPESICNALQVGAQGFIPTLTTELLVALAAIRFVKDGGIFAPLDLLLANGPDNSILRCGTSMAAPLTSCQMTVLSHLRQGKSNKTIARELGMTESTVKAHVRSIMRKMGATNRTQAVYMTQQLGGDIILSDTE